LNGEDTTKGCIMVPYLIVLLAVSSIATVIWGLIHVFFAIFKSKPWPLSLMLVLISYDFFVLLYIKIGIYELIPQLLFTSWPLPFIYGPLLYLHFLMATKNTAQPGWMGLLFLLPFGLMLFLNMEAMLASPMEKLAIYESFRQNGLAYLNNDMEWIAQSIFNSMFMLLTVLTFRKLPLGKKAVFGVIILFTLYVVQGLYIFVQRTYNLAFNQHNLFIASVWVVVFMLFFRFGKINTKQQH
jgi:hypothetical protein